TATSTTAYCPPSLHDALPISQSSCSLGEVVLERLVREQGSREEGADNRREAYGLRGGSEQERDRQRDEEPTVPETQLLSLDLNRSEEHTSELQSRSDLVCRLL